MRTLDRPLPIIGVVHLPPLPGSPRNPGTVRQALDRARADAVVYRRTGVDALLVENHGDAPFDRDECAPHVAAILGVIARALGDEFRCPVGVNVLRNDVVSALGAAVAADAAFVRANVLFGAAATDQGIIEGKAAEALRYRRLLGSAAEIWADIDVKFATPLYAPSLATTVKSASRRSGADRLLVTGPATGSPPSAETLRAVKAAAGAMPVFVASGLDEHNVRELLSSVDGAIVGSTFKEDGDVERPVDPARVTTFMHAVRAVRAACGVAI
jgi:membrane complex biogenesis BtpA family protein